MSLAGHCLCGAVTIAVGEHRSEVGVCHCRMCQRWSGSMAALFTAPPEAVTVEGEVRTYRSSSFAERAFCPACGSPLWFRDDGGDYEFPVGLFDAAADFPLISEIYIDQAFRSMTLAGEHKRATAAEYEARHPHVEKGELP